MVLATSSAYRFHHCQGTLHALRHGIGRTHGVSPLQAWFPLIGRAPEITRLETSWWSMDLGSHVEEPDSKQ